MRICIAEFSHESNTFASIPTTLNDFSSLEGREIGDHYAATFHEIAGFIAGAREFDYELLPLVSARATPAGPLTADTYEALVGRLVDSIRGAQSADGLLLALHGAMVSEGYPHADAETVRRVRDVVGPDFPLVVTHDFHANVPEQLLANVTALVIYKTNPHIDQRECGLLAASIIARTIRGEVKPLCAMVKPEVVLNIVFHNTGKPPLLPIMDAAVELEKQSGVLACSVAAGYQYADVPWMGPSVVVVTDNDLSLAKEEAARLGQMIWDIRDRLILNVPDASTAVEQAVNTDATPVALFEMGDNIGGGSAGDATILLKELMDQNANGWVVTIYDPESVKICARAGIGATVSLMVGGKTDDMHGSTLQITGRVRTLHNGFFEETERRHGGRRYWNQGLTAVVEVGKTRPDKGGLLVLNSIRTTPQSIHQITCVGIQPNQQRILIAKGSIAPIAAYEPVCKKIINVDTPGATAVNRSPAEYRHARKTLYEWRQYDSK
ncbi:MAG: M81 family metallopeptidase [Deltaproteobacteria bacterium]|nr:M81 family metallopeptidase [Deltaproteobacteria bacterium]MBW2153775.1 M81 family metallopeptidase [Deltaproteobacteria bacterium]